MSAIRKLHVGFTISEISIVCHWTYIKIDFLRFHSSEESNFWFCLFCKAPSTRICFLSGYSFCPQASREFDSESHPDIFKCAIQSRNKIKIRNESVNVWTGESGYFLFLGNFWIRKEKSGGPFVIIIFPIGVRQGSWVRSPFSLVGEGGDLISSPPPPKKKYTIPESVIAVQMHWNRSKNKNVQTFHV